MPHMHLIGVSPIAIKKKTNEFDSNRQNIHCHICAMTSINF